MRRAECPRQTSALRFKVSCIASGFNRRKSTPRLPTVASGVGGGKKRGQASRQGGSGSPPSLPRHHATPSRCRESHRAGIRFDECCNAISTCACDRERQGPRSNNDGWRPFASRSRHACLDAPTSLPPQPRRHTGHPRASRPEHCCASERSPRVSNRQWPPSPARRRRPRSRARRHPR